MTQESWDKPAKISNNDIAIGCPICQEGNSKGKKQRCHLYYYDNNLMVHCFNCGMHHHFGKYLKEYFPLLYKQYLLDSGIIKNDFKENPKLESKPKELKLFTFKDIGLDFIPITDSKRGMAYLYSRGVDPKYFKLFYYGNYRNLGDGIVIPFWYNDKMYGFQYRNINKKIFRVYLPPQNQGYKIYNFFSSEKELYVFESVFDLYSNDLPLEKKISAFGSDIDINKFKNKKLIFCFDNDETGYKKALKYAELGFKIFVWPDNIKQKDFNEILQKGIKFGKDPKELRKKISKLIINNTFEPLEAIVRLKLKF